LLLLLLDGGHSSIALEALEEHSTRNYERCPHISQDNSHCIG
jgi:hypothetical protein